LDNEPDAGYKLIGSVNPWPQPASADGLSSNGLLDAVHTLAESVRKEREGKVEEGERVRSAISP